MGAQGELPAPASFTRRATSAALAGVLLFAAFNALSYFALSDATRLLGGTRDGGRIGFPWVVWEGSGRGAGTFYAVSLVQNVAVGLAASAAFGMVVAWATRGRTSPGRSSVADRTTRRKALRIRRQFSLRNAADRHGSSSLVGAWSAKPRADEVATIAGDLRVGPRTGDRGLWHLLSLHARFGGNCDDRRGCTDRQRGSGARRRFRHSRHDASAARAVRLLDAAVCLAGYRPAGLDRGARSGRREMREVRLRMGVFGSQARESPIFRLGIRGVRVKTSSSLHPQHLLLISTSP